MDNDQSEKVTNHQFGLALGAAVATIMLAFWFWLTNALVAAGQTEKLLILVATVSMAWICLDIIKINLNEKQMEKWASELPFVMEDQDDD